MLNYPIITKNAFTTITSLTLGDYKKTSNNVRLYSKPLNHKSLIEACKEVYEEFSSMADNEFHAMINNSELDTLGSLLYETDTVKGYEGLSYTNAMVNHALDVSCGQKEYKLWINGHNTLSTECSDNYFGFNEDEIWKKAA